VAQVLRFIHGENPKGEDSMKSIVVFGAIIALLGIIAFAIPSFNTHETQEVAKLGDLKLQANTEQTHFIPPILSEGMILLGVLIIGAGVLTNRQS
jgi:hypothetical protein